MLRQLRSRLSYANVMSTVGVFIALGGTAYAVNTVGSSDIIDGQVKSVDVGDNEIGSADVKDNSINTFDVHSFLGVDVVDGSLEDQDVGQGTFVDFTAQIPAIPAHECRYDPVTGINAQGDHLLLTPESETSRTNVIYEIVYRNTEEAAYIHSCNVSNTNAAAAATQFNLLVFDAH
jgi:hypothetical protein